MRTLEYSKVGIHGRTDSLIFHGETYSPPCKLIKMPSAKLDNNDSYSPDFTKEVGNLSQSSELYEFISKEEFKEELFRISDETIDLHAKSLLSDSGTESFLLPDSDDDEIPLDGGTGALSEESGDPDGEVQDNSGSENAQRGMLMVPASQNGKIGIEDLTEDSCDMTYLELDLSSQSNEEVSEDEMFTELMKNLKIGVSKISVSSDSCKFDLCHVKDEFDENNPEDLELEDCTEKVLSLHSDIIECDDSVNFMHNDDLEEYGSAKSPNREKRSDFFSVSFLPNRESGLCSLPERTYVKIAESLLDERTLLTPNAEENHLSNPGSCCRTTLNAHDVMFVSSEMASSNKDLKPSFSADETDPTYKMCPMTYVDLDINKPSQEDIALKMLDNLNITDDKIRLCRGNPSEQDEIQNHSLCSQTDESDFDVPSVDVIDSSPFFLEMTNTQIDLNAFANGIGGVSMQSFYSSQTFPSSSDEFNFASSVCLPSFPNDYSAKTFKTFPEANTIEEPMSSEISFLESSMFPTVDSLIQYDSNPSDISFLGYSLENGETPYENEFVTKNLHKLREVNEILGLCNPESQNTIPPLPAPPPPPPAPPSNNLPPCPFSRQVDATNLGAVQNSFATNSPQSFNSNVIPRVTTQTPGTQSDAIPALSGFLFILSTSSVHGLKRPPCFELTEPAKKPFGYDTQNNSGFSEADPRKKAKQRVDRLTDAQLREFVNKDSCLHEAVRSTNYEYVLALLKRLSNHSHNLEIINSKNGKNQTALHLAVQENIPAIVHLLIKYQAEVNHLAMTSSNKLETPLHYVASRGSQFKLVLKCLLEAIDLDINIKNSEGQTALHCAALAHGTGGLNSAHSIDCEYIIKKLLTSGADPLIQKILDSKVGQHLLDRPVCADRYTNNSFTILSYAWSPFHSKVLEDNSGKNMLMSAIESKDLNLLSHIIKTVSKDDMQALLAAKTSNGQTCLSLTYGLKEQFNPMQWEKIINMLTRHTSNK